LVTHGLLYIGLCEARAGGGRGIPTPSGSVPPENYDTNPKRTKMTSRTKKTEPATESKKRAHRTADERVAELQAEIERIRARDAAKQVRASDDGKALIVAVKALDKAAATATETGNQDMGAALERARAPLSELLVEMGLRMPANRGRKLQAV
jgi:hypothetical protein